MAESLYVCQFSNGHVKVGRSVDPKSRIAAHAERVACMGVELSDHFIVECVGPASPRETALILKCTEAASTRFLSEWFIGLDFLSVCDWAQDCARLVIAVDGTDPIPAPRKTISAERRAPIEAAIKVAGGKGELMHKLNKRGWEIASYKVVDQWLLNGIPARYCPDIEDLTDIACELLCPEVRWGLIRATQGSAV
jgi:hypothetical protein